MVIKLGDIFLVDKWPQASLKGDVFLWGRERRDKNSQTAAAAGIDLLNYDDMEAEICPIISPDVAPVHDVLCKRCTAS